MKIAVLIFEGLTALDAVGPIEVLARIPEAEVDIVGLHRGSVRCGAGSGRLQMIAAAPIAAVRGCDVLVVPGGFGVRALLEDERLLQWIREVHRTTTWTASVCTGSLLLAAAGVLKDIPATTHWREMDSLAAYGAVPVHQRVVVHGGIVTAAGVSAGIDMALQLAALIAGEKIAKAIQLQIEYDPEPPFACGSPAKAGPEIGAVARGFVGGRAVRSALSG